MSGRLASGLRPALRAPVCLRQGRCPPLAWALLLGAALLLAGLPGPLWAQAAGAGPRAAAPPAASAAQNTPPGTIPGAPANPAIDTGLAALARGHYATAMRAWRPEAERGNALAQANVGYLHEHGLGVPQSYVEAMVWYRRAAAQNLPQAQFNIGTLYHFGYGVERNPREALNWFRLAARQGLPEAQYMLGLSFHEGNGQPPDAAQALLWFHQAAVRGHAGAQMMAALVYLSGDAGRADPFKAHVWAELALANGLEEAGLVRDYATYRLNARELARARQVASECGQSAYQRCPER